MAGIANTRAARDFLASGPPWLGDSHFNNKDTVRAAGAKWHSATKQWKATDVHVLRALIKSGVWNACDPAVSLHVLSLITHEQAKEESAREEERKRDREQRDAKDDNARRQNMLFVPEDEEDLLELVRSKGVPDETLVASCSWVFLGPRSGLSNVRRLKRGVDLKIVTWEDVASGAAALLHEAPSTGKAGDKGKGVKRGVGKVQNEGITARPGGKRKMPVAAAQPAKPAAFPVRRGKVEYKHLAQCTGCGTEVNGKEQHGLECKCGMWVTCKVCLVPIRSGLSCAACAGE